MHRKNVFRVIIHLIIMVTLILDSTLPVWANTRPNQKLSNNYAKLLESETNWQSKLATNFGDGYQVSTPISPLVEIAHQRVTELAAQPEPNPTLTDNILPPGTVSLSNGVASSLASANPDLSFPEDDNQAAELVDLRTETSKVFQRSDGSGYAIVYLTPIHYQAADGTWHELDPAFAGRLGSDGTPDETRGQNASLALSPLATTATRNGNKDAYAESGYPTTPTGDQFNLYLGWDTLYGKGRTQIFIKFNDPNLPPGTTINNARAYLYQYVVQSASDYQTRVCRINESWGHYTLTWNDRPSVTDCNSYKNTSASLGWKSWNITNYVQAWQNGTMNRGIRINVENQDAPGGIFYSGDCYSQCSNGAYRPYMLIDYTLNPLLRLDQGLDLLPATTVVTGTTITASFRVNNSGGADYNGNLRAYTNGSPTFPEQAVSISSGGGTYQYQQTQVFTTGGTYNVCAQYQDGSWQDLTPDGGVICRTLNVVDPASVILSGTLELTPNELDDNGGSVWANFTVQNSNGLSQTERFRARVITGPITFAETSDVTLDAGQTYTYSSTKTFSQTGIYEVIAEHRVIDNWVPLLGNGNGFIRVQAPPPSPPQKKKGRPPTSGYRGEPVNTSTGNYFYNSTDLGDPTPGLSLAATRWYNAIDAPDVEGPFGYGTSWTYNMTVTWRSDKTALVRMADGHQVYFVGDVDPGDPTNMAGTYYSQEENAGTLGRVSDGSAVLTMTNQTAYHFDAAGDLTRITNPYPAEITVIYDEGRPAQLVHSAGVTYTIAYSGDIITHIESSNGRAVDYSYSGAGDLATITRPDGSTYTYLYDVNHRLTEGRDPNNHAFVRNVYDGQGRVVTQYDQIGQVSHFSYGAQITDTRSYTDTLGNTTIHKYDANYRLIEEVDALGNVVTYTYDAQDNITARRDQNGQVWSYTYDTQGNMLSETDPLGNTSTYTYDSCNNRTSYTDPLGHTWAYQYDANNHLTRTTGPLGHTYEYGYDGQGNVVWERNENGAETQYAYNSLGLQTVITDALGGITRMEYDTAGNQTRYTDAKGNVTQFFYDDLNRLTKSIDPMGTVITFTYDTFGNLLAESDGMGHLKQYTYDAYDRLIAETDFDGNTTQYAYDTLGRPTVVTDALGYATQYTYDAVGNLVAAQAPDGAITQYEYDAAGNLDREIDPLGRMTEYVYDTAGRQVEMRWPCDACAGGVAVSQTSYDAAGRVSKETGPRGEETHYTYDDLGRLATMTDAEGNVTAYSYDPSGQLIQEVGPVGAVTQYAYDALGRLITTTNALGFQTVNQYDAVGNLTQETNTRGYTTTYTYDANDRLVTLTDALGNVTQNAYDAAGRLTSTTDPLGRTTTYIYDASGNQTEETDPRGNTSRTEYDALNRPVRAIDALGNVSTTGYDAMGRVISETDVLGYISYFTYDQAGRRITEQNARGDTTQYTYDSADNLIQRREPTGVAWTFEYDAIGNQVRQIDPLGQTQVTEYDLLSRVTREIDPLGGVTQNTYDAAGQLVTVTDPRGAVTQYEYDALGRQTKETNPLGYTRLSTYDAAGNTLTTQDERGFVTTYTYDELDRQVAETNPLGDSRYTIYDEAGQVTSEVDYRGQATGYTYDAAGNMVTMIDALGNATTYSYDALNRQTSATDANGHITLTQYDAAGRVLKTILPGGGEFTYTYDQLGNRLSETDPAGRTSNVEYDALGRTARELDPLGNATEYQYDDLNNPTLVRDALGQETLFTYDALSRLTRVTDPAGYQATYTYDAAGNLTHQQDANGNTTVYTYDLLGRLTHEVNPLGYAWQYEYDAAGNQTRKIKPDGVTINYQYDALGRQTGLDYSDTTPDVSMTYDEMDNMLTMTDGTGATSYTYDALNRLISVTAPGGQQVGYAYDAVGNRIRVSTPGGQQADYAYGADNWLQAVTTAEGATTYTYDASGLPARIDYPNGAYLSYSYDGNGRVTGVTNGNAGGVFASDAFTLNAMGNKTQAVKTRVEDTGTTVVTIDYTYNARDQLISSLSSDGVETHYTFDGTGNRTLMNGQRRVASGLEAYTISYSYNAANQLLTANDSVRGLTTYTYNANGARARQDGPAGQLIVYTYDAEDRLSDVQASGLNSGDNNVFLPIVMQNNVAGGSTLEQNNANTLPLSTGDPNIEPPPGSTPVVTGETITATDPASDTISGLFLPDGTIERYIYDGQGRRVGKQQVITATGQTAWERSYLYGDGWPVLMEYTTTPTQTLTTRYDYDNGLTKLQATTDGTPGFFHNDGLGSTVGYTDGSGSVLADGSLRDYDDYGWLDPDEDDWFTDSGYTGHEYERSTGLYYARNRYYDSVSGTFLTPDPFPGDREIGLDLHRYSYVQSNPINKTDPLGLFDWSAQTVEKGDTLWSIATAWRTTVNKLLKHNPQINNRNLIHPGQRINLPPCRSAKCQAQVQQQNTRQASTNGNSCGNKCRFNYTVHSDDSLSRIANQFGVPDWHYIWYHPDNYYGINNPNLIRPGQKFYIPCPNEYRITPPGGSGGGSGGKGLGGGTIIHHSNIIPPINQRKLNRNCGTPNAACGPSALAAVALAYGLSYKRPYDFLCDIVKRTGTNTAWWTLVSEFNRLASNQKRKVRAEHFVTSKNKWKKFLAKEMRMWRPVIALWTKPGHYVVVVGMPDGTLLKNMTIMNPWGGNIESITTKRFQKNWEDKTTAARPYQGIRFTGESLLGFSGY